MTIERKEDWLLNEGNLKSSAEKGKDLDLNKRANKRWSKRDIKFLKENMYVLKMSELCRILKRTEPAIRQKYSSLTRTEKKKVTNPIKSTELAKNEIPVTVTVHPKEGLQWKEVLQLFYIATSFGILTVLMYILFVK